jgi:hypothetical protein
MLSAISSPVTPLGYSRTDPSGNVIFIITKNFCKITKIFDNEIV